MKSIVSVLLAITLLITFTSMGYAQSPPAKLGRGLVNTLTGFLELPLNVLRTYKSDGWPKGLTIGFARGLAMGVYRTLVGIYEVVTFVIPMPKDYSAITTPPTLLTSETLVPGYPAARKDFRPLSSEYGQQTPRSSGK